MMTIDLNTLTKGRVRNLSGHERGQAARAMYDLDTLDDLDVSVKILVPDDLDAIATSFFQGMFARSVRHFENDLDFLQHYQFIVRPEILEHIKRGIARVRTRRNDAFSH